MNIRDKLKELEGETFYTVTGKPYTYKFVSENAILTTRTKYVLNLSDFEKAITLNPNKPSEITNIVRGSSYIYGIITDKRFN